MRLLQATDEVLLCFWAYYKVEFFTELAMLVTEVDYLLIAKPVAINHLKIRRDCAWSLVDCADCW